MLPNGPPWLRHGEQGQDARGGDPEDNRAAMAAGLGHLLICFRSQWSPSGL